MRLKLTLLLALASVLPALAQRTGVTGTVLDAYTGSPISGVTVMLNNQGVTSSTGPSGDFLLTQGVQPGEDAVMLSCYGYNDASADVNIVAGSVVSLGNILMNPDNLGNLYYEEQSNDLLFDQNLLDDEEGNSQAIAALTGASDDVYYKAANYVWNTMSFRFRGLDGQYSQTYMNGLSVNDRARGRFNYSSLGGLSRSFRNKQVSIGNAAASYGMGGIGGATNINTMAADYARGFYGSAAFTNSNYMFRAMAQYATGLNEKGWAFTIGVGERYAKEGVIEGTWYQSFAYMVSIQKVFNAHHSINLTTFGAPTERATSRASYQESYDLVGSNLYNPNWGYLNGEKKSASIRKTFDPTTILNWLYKGERGTSVNTAVGLRWVNYGATALNWYNAPDPKPDYYRYLPSYFADEPEMADLYTNLWENDVNFRQLNWEQMYQTNYINNMQGLTGNGTELGRASYIIENRHSNQFNLMASSTVNSRLNDWLTLQGGATFNYTRAHYYKTIENLLGAEYWLDVDQFSEREYPEYPDLLQNDINNPNFQARVGDTFGYDYYINSIDASAWIQNVINLPKWDLNYALSIGYTQFQRDGKMRNGRAPNNSYGKGTSHRFDTSSLKLGATYKIDGHNFIAAHAGYETKAPLFEYAYVSPRIEDTAISDLKPERILTADLSYMWNYRRFRGSITGYWTEMYDQTERTSFYDDQYATFMNYVITGVHTRYHGLELGMAYKVTPSVTVSAAGTVARYRYRNNPMGTRSYENGMMPDTTQIVYLKNFYIGSRPQMAANVGIDWAAPKQWFFNINASWMGDSYVNLSPIHHEALPLLYTTCDTYEELVAKVQELSGQEKLKNAFVLNASIGKIVYVNRKLSLNFNLSVDNILNNRNIVYWAYQQGRFDYTNYDAQKYPNRYSYSQGIKVFFNVGVRF